MRWQDLAPFGPCPILTNDIEPDNMVKLRAALADVERILDQCDDNARVVIIVHHAP